MGKIFEAAFLAVNAVDQLGAFRVKQKEGVYFVCRARHGREKTCGLAIIMPVTQIFLEGRLQHRSVQHHLLLFAKVAQRLGNGASQEAHLINA